MDDPIFRVDFENINSVPDLHYTLKHMESDSRKKYNRSLLGRLFPHRNDPITPAVTEKKPGLRIKLIIKEEAKSWIIKLGIVDTPIVEETDDFRGTRCDTSYSTQTKSLSIATASMTSTSFASKCSTSSST